MGVWQNRRLPLARMRHYTHVAVFRKNLLPPSSGCTRAIGQSSGAGQRHDNWLQQNTNEYAIQRVRSRNETKMAKKLGRKFKGSPNKTVLSKHIRQTQIEVTGHGKTRAYLHRFKLLESATCLCNKGDQTTDHLLYHCTLLQYPREILKKETLRHGTWPLSKHDLITKHSKSFLKFTNSIDFEKL